MLPPKNTFTPTNLYQLHPNHCIVSFNVQIEKGKYAMENLTLRDKKSMTIFTQFEPTIWTKNKWQWSLKKLKIVTVEKSQTNATNATMHLLVQTV